MEDWQATLSLLLISINWYFTRRVHYFYPSEENSSVKSNSYVLQMKFCILSTYLIVNRRTKDLSHKGSLHSIIVGILPSQRLQWSLRYLASSDKVGIFQVYLQIVRIGQSVRLGLFNHCTITITPNEATLQSKRDLDLSTKI